MRQPCAVIAANSDSLVRTTGPSFPTPARSAVGFGRGYARPHWWRLHPKPVPRRRDDPRMASRPASGTGISPAVATTADRLLVPPLPPFVQVLQGAAVAVAG